MLSLLAQKAEAVSEVISGLLAKGKKKQSDFQNLSITDSWLSDPDLRNLEVW